MLRTSILTAAELFDPALRGDWEALVRASSSATPFQTPQWQEAWARHYLGRREIRAFEVREGDDLVALYALVKSTGPWRTIRPLGIGPSDYLHPLTMDGYESAGGVIWVALREQEDCDLIDLHQIREDKPNPFGDRLGTLMPKGDEDPIAMGDGLVGFPGISRIVVNGTPVQWSAQGTCLVLDLPKTYDDFLAMLGKSLRYDVRRLDKTLFTSGRAVVKVAGHDDVERAMDILFDQHKRRWRKRWQPGAFTTRAQRFHREWAAQAIQQGWLRLGVLELDGQPIGAIYGMSLGDTTYFYQAGFDPEYSSVSPGTLLVAATVRQATEEGKTKFDFMRGDEGYKRRWKPQHAYTNYRLILPTNSGRGRLGAKWNVKAGKIEQRIRRRLEGHGPA